VARLVGQIEGGVSSSERKTLEAEADEEQTTTRRSLDELKLAMKTLKKSERRSVGTRPEQCKNDFERQRGRLVIAKEAGTRESLLGGTAAEEERARRERLRGTQSHLDGTSGHLSDAQRSLADTIAKSSAVAETLGGQTESLIRTREHVEGTQAQADIAASHVMDLRARAWTNKCILGFAMLLLLGANIAVLLYGHVLKHSSGSK